jgi:hypothetical protein
MWAGDKAQVSDRQAGLPGRIADNIPQYRTVPSAPTGLTVFKRTQLLYLLME